MGEAKPTADRSVRTRLFISRCTSYTSAVRVPLSMSSGQDSFAPCSLNKDLTLCLNRNAGVWNWNSLLLTPPFPPQKKKKKGGVCVCERFICQSVLTKCQWQRINRRKCFCFSGTDDPLWPTDRKKRDFPLYFSKRWMETRWMLPTRVLHSQRQLTREND